MNGLINCFDYFDILKQKLILQLNVTIICQECMDTVSKQFIFKQKIRKNIQMPSSNVIVQVSKFFSKTKETICSSEHLDVLSIFPENRKRFVETIRMFSPEICMIAPTIKEVLPKSPIESTPHKSQIIYKNTASDTDSETKSNDSSYDANNVSSRKRKKKTVKGRKSNNTKKQKSISLDATVSKQLTLGCF